MRRGRPRHDDVLTPREWEVLDLVRDGLTNEQIAERLGISRDTAKFHVSEILSKLGVESRVEAAAWRGRPRALPALAPAALLRRLQAQSLPRLVGMTVLAAAAVALIGLAAGALLMSTRSPDDEMTPSQTEAHTGVEALDAIIDSLLHDDAADLAARFAGIEAREGALLGGPIGLYQPQPVANADWTARLGLAPRTLHAVVEDPVEPFEWWQQPPQPVPQAAVLDAPRDYDVVLIVGPVDDRGAAWRFSIEAERLIDIVIENAALNPGGPSNVPIITRLGYLTPSPDDDPASFLVLPPEERRPPPAGLGTGSGPSGEPQPPDAPVVEPAIAPDGRTGEPALDALIESLLNDDATTLALKYAGLAATEEQCVPGCDNRRVQSADWTSRLAASPHTLYAVTTDDPADAEIMLAVDSGLDAAEAWEFKVASGRIADLRIHLPWLPAADDRGFLYLPGYYTPSLAREYERFYVLPPAGELPKPPSYHPPSARTGIEGVDRLLGLLEAGAADGLMDAFASTEALPVHQCGGLTSYEGADYLAPWALEAADHAVGVHAVVHLPKGYPVPAQHLMIAVVQVKPLWWQTRGFFEADGRVVAIVTGQWCGPDRLYAAGSFLLPPPAGGSEGLTPERRAGIPGVDGFLDAVQTGDAAALDALIQWPLVACVSQPDDFTPPACPPGVAHGTLVEGIHSGACGISRLRADAPARLIAWLGDAFLYAVLAPGAGETARAPSETIAVLARVHSIQPSPDRPAALAVISVARLVLVDGRVAGVEGTGCGAFDVLWLLDGEPDFLLSPP